MPGKKTYGKRKKSILSLFPVQNDEESPPESEKLKTEKRASATVSMAAFYSKHRNESSRNNVLVTEDRSEEMANKLLDEAPIGQLASKCRNQATLLGSEETLSRSHQQAPFQENILPQLPQLLFNGDKVWDMRSYPGATAAGTSKQASFIGDEKDFDICPPPISRQPSHARRSSAPPLPRKSSKRASRRPKQGGTWETQNINEDSKRQTESRKLTKATQHLSNGLFHLSEEANNTTSIIESPDVTQQIEAMLIASKTLKPTDQNTMSDTPVSSKKIRLNGVAMLSKMKNIINEALLEKGLKKIRHPAKTGELLDPSLSRLPDYEDEISTVSAIELRLNEGTNFNNPKIQSLTGHGTIRRKPVAEDGKSLKSPKSGDDPFLDDHNSPVGRKLNIAETRGKRGMSSEESAEYIPPLPGISHRLKANTTAGSSVKRTESSFEVNFDALFSSSPLAQSTPRIRLEPSFEDNGHKKLKHVPASSRSLFDAESLRNKPYPGLATSPTTIQAQNTPTRKVVVKRNSSQVKDEGLGVKSHLSKRRKKHPSPSKAELEGLEDALRHYSPLMTPMDNGGQEELAVSFGELRTGGILQDRDNNIPLRTASKRWPMDKRPAIPERKEPSKTGLSLAEPARRYPAKARKASMIPKPTGGAAVKERIKSRTVQLREEDGSAMETDELQWDLTAYQVGTKRA